MTVIISLFSSIQAARTILKAGQGSISIRQATVWIILWGAIGFGSLFPSRIDYFVRAAQMGDRMFFILLISVLVLFAVVFGMTARLDRMQRDFAKLVQEQALMRFKTHKDQQPNNTEINE